MRIKRPVVIIVDNSISFTGAFKCALQQALLLQGDYEYIFVLPRNTNLLPLVASKGFQCYTLPLLEVRKNPLVLLNYIPRLIRNSWRLRKIIKKEKAVVLIMNDFYNLLGVTVKCFGFRGKLITYVRFLPSSLPSVLKNIWTGLAQKYSDAVIAVSDAVLHQLPKQATTMRIYDAVVLEEQLPKKRFNTSGRTVFLYLANYIRGKGQNYALVAFMEALKQNGNLLLTFAGSDMGLEKNKAFKKELEQYVVDHQLQNEVIFEAFHTDIEVLIKSADVVLNFSEAESFSMTCAEASFYGVPVIATRCGGPEEIVVHQKTGLLVDKGNINQMCAAMLALANHPDIRTTYGQEATKLIHRRFNAEEFINQFKVLLVSSRIHEI